MTGFLTRAVFLLSCVAVVGLLPGTVRAEDELVRNPFWPQGYNGKRHPISAEPRFKVERPKKASGSASAVRLNDAAITAYEMGLDDPMTRDPIWAAAVKTLHFGSTLSFTADEQTQAAITINDRIYAVGDLISLNFKGLRLTWRVETLSSDGKLKLKRLTYRKIGTNK